MAYKNKTIQIQIKKFIHENSNKSNTRTTSGSRLNGGNPFPMYGEA